jgi:hypothetical protein
MDTFLQIDTSHRELLVKTAKRVLETGKGNVNMAEKINNLSQSSKLTEQQRESLIAPAHISRLANEINAHETITITFGDRGENHARMQIIGKEAEHGFTKKTLRKIQKKYEAIGIKTKLVKLSIPELVDAEKAYILILRDAVKNADEILRELRQVEWDEYAFMYGTVKKKHARHNVCFSEFAQEPDYKNKKGRIVQWDNVPLLKDLKLHFENLCKLELVGEGNRYYDSRKCGIGYHGDSERRIVIGARFGKTMNLVYQWYHRGKPVGNPFIFEFNHGDLYLMSEKAVGSDWKSRTIPTLRHSAGCKKYTGI